MSTLPDQLPIEPLPGPFDVTLTDLPGSKSLTNRALLLAALAEGTSTLTNVLFSDDTRVMMAALDRLGFELQIDEPARTVTVTGGGGAIPAKTAELYLGNAGTAMRFLTAACCLGAPGSVYTLDGVPRMRHRPIGQLVEALKTFGATPHYAERSGYPPLRIEPRGLRRDDAAPTRLPNTISSQFISAVLQVGPYVNQGATVLVDTPVISAPYVRMTLDLMRHFGGSFQATADLSRIEVRPGTYRATNVAIEPDASNASYFLAAAAVTPGARCVIDKLGRQSVQGDAAFVAVLGQMGAAIDVQDHSITVTGPDTLSGIDVDLNHMPDMAQTLAVVALFAQGPTTIRNVGNLRVKETDRIAALQNELTKLGATVDVRGDDLTIAPPPGNRLHPATIDTYDDHRMAMSFAVAGLRCPGVVINDPGCVAKTFPDYFEYLNRLRAAADAGKAGG